MKKLILILTLLLSVIVSCQLSVVSDAYAAIPHLISYQGRLTDADGNPKEDGAYSITFRIYDAEAGGSLLWHDTYSVTVTDGILSVLLGSGGTPLNLPFDKQYYLALHVGGDLEEMTPRQQIASVGYAYKAEKAEESDTVGGIQASVSPEANKLVALDANAKLPTTAFKTYDSGWFPVTGGSKEYVKTHNLGTTKVLVALWVSENADGSNAILTGGDPMHWGGYGNQGLWVYKLSTTQVTILSSDKNITSWSLGSNITSGYARILMLALE